MNTYLVFWFSFAGENMRGRGSLYIDISAEMMELEKWGRCSESQFRGEERV